MSLENPQWIEEAVTDTTVGMDGKLTVPSSKRIASTPDFASGVGRVDAMNAVTDTETTIIPPSWLVGVPAVGAFFAVAADQTR